MTDAEVIALSTAESLTNDADYELDELIEAADRMMRATVDYKAAKARVLATTEAYRNLYTKYYGRPYEG